MAEVAYNLNPGEEAEATRQMRQNKKNNDLENSSEESKQPQSLRQRIAAARRAMDLKQRAKDKIKEKITSPAKMGTAMGLRWAWGALIPSWGLSFLVIDLLAFMHLIFPSVFCEIGDEWIPPFHPFGNKMGEKLVFWFLNALLLLLILFIVSFFVDEGILKTMQKET